MSQYKRKTNNTDIDPDAKHQHIHNKLYSETSQKRKNIEHEVNNQHLPKHQKYISETLKRKEIPDELYNESIKKNRTCTNEQINKYTNIYSVEDYIYWYVI